MIRSLLLLTAMVAPYFGSAQNNPAKTREYKKLFTTYPFSDPDPIPKPDSKIYPYYRFDGFAATPIKKEWNVVELENDYIRITILPEIGGKIWSATEKSTGKDFIYNNHVVKFRDIAMRGPWTSGGIEANYGIIGHTPNCATPVDYMIRTKEDGSVSCVIGVLDLLTRTYWSLDINLPKDKAYFTTTSFWHNSTPLEQPYYTWMNTGIKAAGNLQFIYPGNKYLGHEGEYDQWPINPKNGKDISWYENNNFGGYKSYHVFGKYTDFFGAYWHNDDFGMGHFSRHDDKAGKKIWIWGLSQQGMIWEKLLTDTDGQYVEVQSGRLFNQSAERSIFTPFKHRSFLPGQSDTWTEYWFPVKGSKGFVDANDFGVVNVVRRGEWLKIYFSPLQHINEKLQLFNDGVSFYQKDLNSKPLETFVDSARFTGDVSKLRLTLGENKIVWSASAADDLQRPVATPTDFDNNSVYGLYLQGKNLSSFRDYVGAEAKLSACLQKDPYFVPALTEMASLQLRRFQFDDARATAKKALSIDTYNEAANYHYALANLRLGNLADAKDGFDLAAQGIEFRTVAYAELSKLYLREKEIAKATVYANKSLQSNMNNIDAMQVLVVCHRLQNQNSEAEKIRNFILAVDPLNHFASFEKYLADKSDVSRAEFSSSIRNEMPYQTYLELAIWYYQVGCSKEALQVLSLSPAVPEVVYWRSFLQGKPADLNLIKLGNDFPFRAETANVLYQLIETENHWQLKYHLGLIEWSRNNLDAAKKLFSQCGDEPTDPNFYASKASLFKEESITEASLNKAITLNPQEWRYPKLLAEHFISKDQVKQARDLIANYYQQHQQNYVIGMLYAKTLLLNREFKTCSDLLSSIQILPFEGATIGRHLYEESKLMQAVIEMKSKRYKAALQMIALAREWPTNLGAGKPYQEDIDERLEDWLEYNCHVKLGESIKAKNTLQRIIKFTPQVDNTVANFLPGNHLISAWALEKNSSHKEGEEWLRRQVSIFPASKITQWSLLTFNHEKSNLSPGEKDLSVRVLEQLMQLDN